MKNKHGFTLVELLIAMGLTTVLIIILAQVFGSILTLRQKSEAVSAVAQDSRFIVMRLAYDLDRADSVTLPLAGQSGSTLALVIDSHAYTYTYQVPNLTLSIDGSPPQIINSVGSGLTLLSFTRGNDFGGGASVGLSFTLIPTSTQIGLASVERQVTTTLVQR